MNAGALLENGLKGRQTRGQALGLATYGSSYRNYSTFLWLGKKKCGAPYGKVWGIRGCFARYRRYLARIGARNRPSKTRCRIFIENSGSHECCGKSPSSLIFMSVPVLFTSSESQQPFLLWIDWFLLVVFTVFIFNQTNFCLGQTFSNPKWTLSAWI